MNSEPSTARRISAWLHDEAPARLPERVLEATFERTQATVQQPTLRPRRFLIVRSLPVLVAVGAAALIVVLVAGTALLGGRGRDSVGGSVVASSREPSPSASVTGCSLPLMNGSGIGALACRYRTATMSPAWSISGPADVNPALETARGALLQVVLPGGDPTAEGLAVFTVDRLALQPCDPAWQRAGESAAPYATRSFRPRATGTGPADFISWLADSAHLAFPPPQATEIDGRPGLTTTVAAAAGSLNSCGGAIAITWTSDTPGELGAEGLGKGPTRLTAIDVDGTTVVFEVYAPAGRLTEVETAVDKLLATLRFE